MALSVDRINGISGDLAIKAPVRVATTANITLAGFQTIDGVTPVEADTNLRVLVKNQTDTTQNGIYNMASGTWLRSTDFNGAYDVVKGTEVTVQEGTVSGGFFFVVATADPIVIGTSALTFTSSTAAANSATAAAASAVAAQTAETNAETAETNAELAEANAAASAAAAQTAETNAETAETNAELAEANAAASAALAALAADAVMWNDVVFKTFADSPITIVDADTGKLFAIDCSGGAVVVNLPAIAGLTFTVPWSVGFKKTEASANAVTINRASTDTIDGGTSLTMSSIQGRVLIPDTDPAPDVWTSMQFGADAIADGTVTLAKLADLANSRLIARKTAGTGVPESVTLSELLDFVGSAAQGDILYRGAAAWGRLGAGTSGQFLKTLGAAADPLWAAGGITLGTAVASTSGTSIDFTGLPAGTKRVTINLAGVSTNGNSDLLFQIGDSDGIETAGYLGASSRISAATPATTNYTTGFGLNNGVAANIIHGSLTLRLIDAANNTWAATGAFATSNGNVTVYTSGSKSLSTALDRVRITSLAGADTFDAGTINISYES